MEMEKIAEKAVQDAIAHFLMNNQKLINEIKDNAVLRMEMAYPNAKNSTMHRYVGKALDKFVEKIYRPNW